MRAFVQVRRALVGHEELARKLDALEKRYDQQFRVAFDAIRQLLGLDRRSRRRRGFFLAAQPEGVSSERPPDRVHAIRWGIRNRRPIAQARRRPSLEFGSEHRPRVLPACSLPGEAASRHGFSQAAARRSHVRQPNSLAVGPVRRSRGFFLAAQNVRGRQS
jgi:hypothetical protein